MCFCAFNRIKFKIAEFVHLEQHTGISGFETKRSDKCSLKLDI